MRISRQILRASLACYCLVAGTSVWAASCQVNSITQINSPYQLPAKSSSGIIATTEYDANGVSQLYVGGSGSLVCLSCAAGANIPAVSLNKLMQSWHPSGKWLTVGVEFSSYILDWLPQAWKRGLLSSGVWLSPWAVEPAGNRWHQIFDLSAAGNPSFGYTGVLFSPDGGTGIWAEIVGPAGSTNALGVWRLYRGTVSTTPDGFPTLINKQDITPAGARWVETGNFAPDGRHILLSTDIGLSDAQGQDQWSLDISSGALKQLTKSPTVWDEHGLYSPDGKQIVWMSSLPYASDPTSNQTFTLKTEFMLMNSDGTNVQQLTHFNVPGYPESQPGRTVAGLAWFVGPNQLYGSTIGPNFSPVGWAITLGDGCVT